MPSLPTQRVFRSSQCVSVSLDMPSEHEVLVECRASLLDDGPTLKLILLTTAVLRFIEN